MPQRVYEYVEGLPGTFAGPTLFDVGTAIDLVSSLSCRNLDCPVPCQHTDSLTMQRERAAS